MDSLALSCTRMPTCDLISVNECRGRVVRTVREPSLSNDNNDDDDDDNSINDGDNNNDSYNDVDDNFPT